MIIYKITNSINSKVYIGQTTKSLEDRMKNHHNSMVSGVNTHLYNAMRKYGWDKFKFEIVVETDNQETLDELEKFYIEKYDSIRNGYNMIPGGNSNPMDTEEVLNKHNAIMRSDAVRKKISESMKLSYKKRGGPSLEHRKHLSENKKNLYNSERGDAVRAKFRQSFHLSEEHYRALNDAKNKAVYCIDLAGNIVAEFNRIIDAADWWMQRGYDVKYRKTVCGAIKRSYTKNQYIHGLKWIYRV